MDKGRWVRGNRAKRGKGSLEPGELFGDVEDVGGFEGELVGFFTLKDALEVDGEVLGLTVHGADNADAFQVSFGVIEPAGFHDSFEGGERAIREDFAGTKDGAGNVDGESGRFNADADFFGLQLGTVLFEEFLFHLGRGEAGRFKFADGWECDPAVASDGSDCI